MFSLSLKKQKKNQFIDIPPENGNEETVNNGNDTPSAMAPPTTQGPVTAQNNDVSKLNYDSKTKQEKADTSQSQGYGQTSGTTSNPIVHVPVTHKEPKGFSRTMKSASSWMKDYSTAVKHGRMKPYAKTERKVRAATRNKPWGPHGGQLVEIAKLSFNPGDCALIFSVLENRMQYPPEKWRNVYKALSVLEYLVQRGSDDAVNRAKSENVNHMLRKLEGFAYITTDSRDVGSNVSHRARAIRMLLEDEGQLAKARENGRIQSLRMAGIQPSMSKASPNGMQNNAIDHTEGEENDEGDEGTTTSEDGESMEDTAPGLANAGETKGVSPEDNARHIAALKKILARKENSICADCGLPGTGSKPTWASVSLGVFICLRCAGIHRGLGVHISQVRSCSLDSWLYNQVEFMALCGGNTNANAYWEFTLGGSKPPMDTIGQLENFIKEKYVEKKFVDPNTVWPPVEVSLSEEVMKILEEAMGEEIKALKEEEATRVAEAMAQLNQKEVPAQSPVADFINLMDAFDGPQVDSFREQSATVVTEVVEKPANYMDLLQDVFTEAPSKNEDPVSKLQSPPVNFDSWDMSRLIQEESQEEMTLKAKELSENQNDKSIASGDGKSSGKSKYQPFWAPASEYSTATSDGNTLMITEGPIAEFDNAFNFVPSQFTTRSDKQKDANELAETLATIGIGSLAQQKKQAPQITKSHSLQPEQNLKPHEKKAQDLLLGVLDSFDTKASIASSASPTGLSTASSVPQPMKVVKR